jgi:hypothetical protein
VDQYVELALQLVTPVFGPCQLSVQAGWALLGVSVAKATTPIDANEATTTASAAPALRNPCIIICSRARVPVDEPAFR